MPVDLESKDRFPSRHIGPDEADVAEMLATLGLPSLDALVAETVPADIRLAADLKLSPAVTEAEVLAELRTLSEKNQVWRSYLGLGYSDCVTPPVVLRNIIENPGWYTQYTPYQAEISQGRLEALLNFQTDGDGPDGAARRERLAAPDEGTAAAEAMHMHRRRRAGRQCGRRIPPRRLRRLRRLPSADDRGRAHARQAPRRRGRGRHRRLRVRLHEPARVRRPRAVPRYRRRARDGRRMARALREGPRRGRAGRARDGSARAHRPRVAGRARRRRRYRQRAALRRAARLRAGRTPRTSRRSTSGCASSPAASSASRRTPTATWRCAWRWRRASSTFAARRRRATSAPRRCSSPSSRACTPCGTGRRACAPSPSVSAAWRLC